MTEGVDPGKTINRLASYLDRLIDFFFSLPLPVSIINLVPSDKSSRSLRLSTFLIRFAGGDSPNLDRFSESARLFSSISTIRYIYIGSDGRNIKVFVFN